VRAVSRRLRRWRGSFEKKGGKSMQPDTSSDPDRLFHLELTLLIGSGDGFTDTELERGWRLYGKRLTEDGHPRSMPGFRPWGWWRFEAGREEPPRHDEAVLYLAERGELRDHELAAIAERANEGKPRIGTPAEHYGPNYYPDRDAVSYMRPSSGRSRADAWC
jgi:hypothetical protein